MKVKDGSVGLSYPMLTKSNYTAWLIKMKVFIVGSWCLESSRILKTQNTYHGVESYLSNHSRGHPFIRCRQENSSGSSGGGKNDVTGCGMGQESKGLDVKR